MTSGWKPGPAALVAISQDFGHFCERARCAPDEDKAILAELLKCMADDLLVAAFADVPHDACAVKRRCYRMIEDSAGISFPLES